MIKPHAHNDQIQNLLLSSIALLAKWIQACTVFAETCLYFATFHSLGTAIATIVRATAVVVLVVAVAVSFVVREFACAITAIGIQALAVFAELRLHFATLHSLRTTITAIVLATAVVVLVVAVAISFVILELALALTDRFDQGIQAIALLAEVCLHFATIHGFGTAIATIPIAAAVIVLVIAIAISFVFRELAIALALRVDLWVQASASLAIFSSDDAVIGPGAAVTSVPIALTIVILVVTVPIFLVAGGLAAFLSGTIFLLRLRAVSALTQLAIFDVRFVSTAVAAVPSAAANVVVVIAEAVSLELGSATAFLEVVDTLITFLHVCAVLAFAFFAVFVIFGTATVASIPAATSVIVVIVTVSIAFPVR